uniref:Uncharacterized protein n=1 Tax=Lactuca sativa TaxID=4236 RepID=A0A9R1X0U2_LACSA|nr:hypothetical protein LSAT_V11C700371410 [Lactuca sativa]
MKLKVSLPSDSQSRRTIIKLIVMASLIFGLYHMGNPFFAHDFKCRPQGTDVLPTGILAKTSDLEMRPLWGSDPDNNNSSLPVSLLAIAAGIKQKYLVNKIITKFLENGFVVMVFHYDGIVDQWDDLQWSSRVIHISAANQTKWFAKRFLHPDIVAEYDYIFLWDEDLDVEHFNPSRYISIVKEEKLDISQPALDPSKSEIHHQITVRGIISLEEVEGVMATAQGDRKQKVGVVDAEYIVHLGVPSLGGSNHASKMSITNHVTTKNSTLDTHNILLPSNSSDLPASDERSEVRRQSYNEMRVFWRRWDKAVENDKCWVDPYAN